MANELERNCKERKRKERGTEERKGKNERKERKKKHGRGIREEMKKNRREKEEEGQRWWSGLGCLQNFDLVCGFVVAWSRITDKNHLSQKSRQKEKNKEKQRKQENRSISKKRGFVVSLPASFPKQHATYIYIYIYIYNVGRHSYKLVCKS